jgi:hypothetical protein
MSLLLSASDVAVQALRDIGEMSIYDTEPDPVALSVALQRLDLLVAELCGTENVWWLRPLQVDVPLTSGVRDVSLETQSPRMEFYSHATLVLSTDPTPQREIPLRLISWQDYARIEQKDAAGQPECVYIQRRDDSPTASLYRVPATNGLVLRLTGQVYADILTSDHGRKDHGLPAAWQMWMIKQLAADIGAGPVRTIPLSDRQDKQGRAQAALVKLMARNNRQNIDRPRTVAAWLP